MFTGIVERVGEVVAFLPGVMEVKVGDYPNEPIQVGESIAINGCCLTVVPPLRTDGVVRFDLSPETLSRTSFDALNVGAAVNIERAMKADGRFGGHIVQGHVDATGFLLSITPIENSIIYRFQVPMEYDRYLIDKGSITVEGISLTVVEPKDGAFDVWIIPHTIANTSLKDRQVGDAVNLEFDVIARHIEKLLLAQGRAK